MAGRPFQLLGRHHMHLRQVRRQSFFFFFFHTVDNPEALPSSKPFALCCIIDDPLRKPRPGLADYSYQKLCQLIYRYQPSHGSALSLHPDNVVLFCLVIPLKKVVIVFVLSWHEFLSLLLRTHILNNCSAPAESLLRFGLCHDPAIRPSPFLHILE